MCSTTRWPRRKVRSPAARAEVERVEGGEWIDEVVLVDQSPIGRTPRSNPVTYIKAFDGIRELFASLPESEKRGYTAGHFSFNIPGGRCETCQGDGTVTVEMQFLADVELICEECKGTRYKPEILEIRYHGKNIHDVLDLTMKEALHFFSGVPKIVEKLRVLEEVGLGYLRLGQSATTLSGGEAQRMKLAAHLQPRLRDIGKPRSERDKRQPRMLYIFDEPTTGLHFDDVSKLLAAFRRLIEAGGSIVVIEHNLDVIKTADWVIDLGPEGGARGGEVVAVGPPEAISDAPNSYTGQWLARVLPRDVPAHPMKLASSITVRLLGTRRRSSCSPRICHAQQESKPTIRHHRVEEPRPLPTPVLILKSTQAEEAMQHNDFAAAEPLLQKAVAAKPNDYRAWFDLGYVYNATAPPCRGNRRLSQVSRGEAGCVRVEPEPWPAAGQTGRNAEAAKYLKAATQLKPTNAPQSQD
jgi:ABC-type multidrug transport system ATPase subunit